MYKCSGVCSECGRCFIRNHAVKAAGLEPAVLLYPEDFEPEKTGDGFGVALDIGTTTVAGTLWDLAKGVQLAAASELNPQIECGRDVISRIAFCQKGNNNLDLLKGLIRECAGALIKSLCAKAGVSPEDVIRLTVCGNTTMSHIFAGYSPQSLAMAPFEPAYKGEMTLTGTNLKLGINKNAEVILLPGIASHVGGDITAGIDAVRLDRPERIEGDPSAVIFVDIGTNGEIVLSDEGRLFACSTAAGPAFEGGNISWGMRAAAGAIEEINIEGGYVTVKTIDGEKALGICGSGLIDAAAKMLDAGIIDETGKLTDTLYLDRDRIIYINQKDIRELQLAKSAIRAGIKALLNRAGRDESDINKIIVAGAFGNGINAKSALRIGLLPDVGEEKVFGAGNTAAAGAAMALVSRIEQKRINCIADLVQHVELATDSAFQELFMDYINFTS